MIDADLYNGLREIVSTLASSSKTVQRSGGHRRMGHGQVKQSLDGAHAYDKLAGYLLDLTNLG